MSKLTLIVEDCDDYCSDICDATKKSVVAHHVEKSFAAQDGPILVAA